MTTLHRPHAHRHGRRRRRRLTGALTVAVALALTGALVGAIGGPASAAVPAREVSTKITVVGASLAPSDNVNSSNDPAIGKTAPTITGQGFDDKKVSFANDGKPRALIFVAHWCPHCRAEVPRLVKLAKQGKLAGVEVQAVATNTSKDYPNYPPSKWLKREKWPFSPVLADDSGSRALQAFGGQSFPFFVLIGADGKIAARADGELSPATIAKAFKALVAGTSVFS